MASSGMRSNYSILTITLTVLLAVSASLVAGEARPSTKSKDLSGKELLDKNGCLNCHFVNGEGMPPANLSREDIEQLTDFLLTLPVRNQKSKKPISP
jgi:CxxC motif-containing protein (DUF1111 family)